MKIKTVKFVRIKAFLLRAYVMRNRMGNFVTTKALSIRTQIRSNQILDFLKIKTILLHGCDKLQKWGNFFWIKFLHLRAQTRNNGTEDFFKINALSFQSRTRPNSIGDSFKIKDLSIRTSDKLNNIGNSAKTEALSIRTSDKLNNIGDSAKTEALSIRSQNKPDKRRVRIIKRTIVLVFLSALVLLALSLYIPFPKGKLKPAPVISLTLVDRNNTVLREILSDEGGRCRWVELREVSPDLLRATVVAEDRAFYLHPGVNPVAIARAMIQNIRHRQVVSGASTISQQVVRNIYRHRRTIFAKMYEIWLALRLEHTISKDKILTQYLNRIYYGNQAYGIAAASRLYFDKPPEDLSLAEAAFLAGLPRSPTVLNPYRNFRGAKKRQEYILLQMYKQGNIDQNRWTRAKGESLQLIPARKNFRAPHFCEFVLSQVPLSVRQTLSRIQTTCDYTLQKKIEDLVKDHISALEKKNITNASVVVLDNVSGEILSMVGSKNFFDEHHDGQVNGAVSLRQPGSTLKPFTYGLALERGMTAADILDDRDTYFLTPKGSYSPQNYDERFHGAVRLRHALACSYNVPAVSLLEKLGTDLLFQRLKLLGFASLDKSPTHYGVGLTLGNGEVTLLELTRAYSSLARGGLYAGEKAISACFDSGGRNIGWEGREKPRRVFLNKITYVVSDILSDRDARSPAFGYLSPLNLPFKCAVKTGTSVDFRDNWTIGYTRRYTVGVWVGNFDATPMFNVSGITGCGPLFKDIMLLLEGKNPEVDFIEAKDVTKARICPLSGKLATEHCPGAMEEIFIEGTEPEQHCQLHNAHEKCQDSSVFRVFRTEEFKIAFPQDRDTFKIDPVLRAEFQRIKFKVKIPTDLEIDSVEWWIDDRKIGVSVFPYSVYWDLMAGQHTIRAIAVRGKKKLRSRSIKIQVEKTNNKWGRATPNTSK
jgi:penicillin-binding protein 1C